jgi:hypothetical protein
MNAQRGTPNEKMLDDAALDRSDESTPDGRDESASVEPGESAPAKPGENMRCELEDLPPPPPTSTSESDTFIHHPPTQENSSDSAFRLPPSALPFVSVVIPCYNEERFIEKVLENLSGQYERAAYEIIVVDGMSEDGTRARIERFRQTHAALSVRVLDNAERNIPAALNLGIEAARGDIVVRMDAHSVASAGYVRRCVEVLSRGTASVVGMPWRIRPGAESLTARAVALAVAHPFGIGDAKYRLSDGDRAGGRYRALRLLQKGAVAAARRLQRGFAGERGLRFQLPRARGRRARRLRHLGALRLLRTPDSSRPRSAVRALRQLESADAQAASALREVAASGRARVRRVDIRARRGRLSLACGVVAAAA